MLKVIFLDILMNPITNLHFKCSKYIDNFCAFWYFEMATTKYQTVKFYIFYIKDRSHLPEMFSGKWRGVQRYKSLSRRLGGGGFCPSNAYFWLTMWFKKKRKTIFHRDRGFLTPISYKVYNNPPQYQTIACVLNLFSSSFNIYF